MSSTRLLFLALLVTATGSITQTTNALTMPFTEDFTSGPSNWREGTGAGNATFVPSGGPDGSSHIASTASAFFLDTGDPVVVFRGQNGFDSSGDAFVGNWISAGANRFSTWVWHDAPVPLDFFVRFATSGNSPATAADKGALIPANTWTQLTYIIDPSNIFNPISNPTGYLFTEGPSSFFNSTFTSLGNIQVGYSVPAGFGLINQSFNFAMDQPSISNVVPEPASWVMILSVALAGVLRRRRAG